MLTLLCVRLEKKKKENKKKKNSIMCKLMEYLENEWFIVLVLQVHACKRKWLISSYDMATIGNMREESGACTY